MSDGTTGNSKKNNSHKWRFVRIGGFDHVLLDRGEDLINLEKLDYKLWAALSCPTTGLEFDSKTLVYMDTQGDGRIRAEEVIAAVKWTLALLKNPDDLTKGASELPLSAINDSTPEGKTILSSAKEIVRNLGKTAATTISVSDTADSTKIFANTVFNGDGIIVPGSADAPQIKAVIENIITCVGSVPDRSGTQGIDLAKVEQFYAEAKAYAAWVAESESQAAEILPFNEHTAAAADLYAVLREKIDDYFARCNLVKFDNRALDSLNPSVARYDELALKPLALASSELAELPLAQIGPHDDLPLLVGINPAFRDQLAQFTKLVVIPLFGDKAALTFEEWMVVRSKIGRYLTWSAGKKGAAVESLGIARVREILAGNSQSGITGLIAKDKELEAAANSIASVDKLLHYFRDLSTLLNNFVSFYNFYSEGQKAIFQAGTLFMDGRSCDLCILVNDVAAHSALANLGRSYLAYCECTRKDRPDKIKIAAAFTDGDADNLMVGRNGVFYDRKNLDWDATIVKIVEHPISVRQAFAAPYKRIGKMIGDQIEKMAAAKDKAIDASASSTIATAGEKVETAKPAPAPPFDVGKFAGIFAAIGLAIGAIGTAIAAVVTGFLKLAWWQMPLSIIGLILIISGPSMIIAALKLRQRNLAPLLDACGWAVNTRAKINIPFGKSLTAVAELPTNSSRSLSADPFAQKKRPWRTYIILLVLLGVLGAAAYLKRDTILDKIGLSKAPTQTEQTAAPAEPGQEP